MSPNDQLRTSKDEIESKSQICIFNRSRHSYVQIKALQSATIRYFLSQCI